LSSFVQKSDFSTLLMSSYSCYQSWRATHGSHSTWHNIRVGSCRMSPHRIILQRFIPCKMQTCLSCQNAYTSIKSGNLLQWYGLYYFTPIIQTTAGNTLYILSMLGHQKTGFRGIQLLATCTQCTKQMNR
jgi:hypothetical protein